MASGDTLFPGPGQMRRERASLLEEVGLLGWRKHLQVSQVWAPSRRL